MDLKLLFAAVFLFAIASAIISDASRLVIPNWVPAILAGSFFPYALVYYGCSDALLHALVAFGLLAVGTILFLRGQFGAGDVKLLAAAGLWAGPAKVIPLVVWTSLAGLALAGTIVIYWWYLGRYHEAVSTRFPMKQLAQWAKIGLCPYGIAIGAGALATVPAVFF
jgi:prepilin peptidase CpaA